MKKLGIGLFVLLSATVAFSQAWLPHDPEGRPVINHFAVTLGYDERHEVPQWVAYILRKEHLRNCTERGNDFREDPLIQTGSSTPEDYHSSGYDRGHIAPAGDMKWSREAMKESFLMSNITPQTPGMNRGAWASLENLVRAWAKEGDETIIVSGPVLEDSLPRIGANGVSVPKSHFKVLLRIKNGQKQAIGFLMDQNPLGKDLKIFALTVRQIEELTGLDFFPHLSKSEQMNLETRINWSNWNFKANFTYLPCSGQ